MGWTNLSGAVPDADDTPAALLAIASLDLSTSEHLRLRHQSLSAVAKGLRWIVALQNRDGGWPTFCKGWGKLPFDRSGTDLTAHALRAIHAWQPQLDVLQCIDSRAPSSASLERATQRGLRYLQRTQRADGSWLPLWFGNQDHLGEENPIYGTSKTLIALLELGLEHTPMATSGLQYLVRTQNGDGGWGGGASVPYKSGIDASPAIQPVHSSIEETALALEALLQCSGVALGRKL